MKKVLSFIGLSFLFSTGLHAQVNAVYQDGIWYEKLNEDYYYYETLSKEGKVAKVACQSDYGNVCMDDVTILPEVTIEGSPYYVADESPLFK